MAGATPRPADFNAALALAAELGVECQMNLFASLDPKDRKLLIGCMCAVAVLAVITAFFARNQNSDDNPVPSTYLHRQAWRARRLRFAPGQWLRRRALGAAAERSAGANRRANRSDLRRTLSYLTRRFQSRTGNCCARRARAADGMVGRRFWLPAETACRRSNCDTACKLTPQGLDPLAASGEVWMVPEAAWGSDQPLDRVEYNCAGRPP